MFSSQTIFTLWHSTFKRLGMTVDLCMALYYKCSFEWPWPLSKVTVGHPGPKISVELSQQLTTTVGHCLCDLDFENIYNFMAWPACLNYIFNFYFFLFTESTVISSITAQPQIRDQSTASLGQSNSPCTSLVTRTVPLCVMPWTAGYIWPLTRMSLQASFWK